MTNKNHPYSIALFNDPMQNNPVVLEYKFDYSFGCAFHLQKYADIDFSSDILRKVGKI